MKRKLVFLLLAVISVISLASCNLIINDNTGSTTPTTPTKTSTEPTTTVLDPEKPWLHGKSVMGHELSYDLKLEEFDTIRNELETAKGYCQNERNYDEFCETYDNAEDYYYASILAYKCEYLTYCMYGNEANQDKYVEYQGLNVDIVQWFNEVEHMCFKNSFKADFFGDMTDEEIIERIGKEYPEAYYDLQKEINQLQADFLALDDSDSKYYDKIDAIYVQFVKKSNQIAVYDDFDNFLDYTYDKYYTRDFKKEDTDNFFSYVMQYVLPKYKSMTSYIKSFGQKNSPITNEENEILHGIYESDVFLNSFEKLEGYKEYMGDIFKEAFDGLFKKDGYYNISYDDNSYPLAFQDSFRINGEIIPYVYYGNGYHNAVTVIHEFGHYFAALHHDDTSVCYDLCETQSQANEYLFLEYLTKTENYSDNLKKAIMDYHYYDSYQTIMLASLVNEVEKKCYSKEEFAAGDLSKFVDELFTTYPELSTIFSKSGVAHYIGIVSIDSPGYYISYATSLVGSLNVDMLARESFASGKEAYLKLINYEGVSDYRDVYEYAGLMDPLSLEAFRYIF